MKKKSFSKIATTLIHKLKREIIEDLFKIYIFSSGEKEKKFTIIPDTNSFSIFFPSFLASFFCILLEEENFLG